MAAPTVTALPANTWTKVAAAVQNIIVRYNDFKLIQWAQRTVGGATPTGTDSFRPSTDTERLDFDTLSDLWMRSPTATTVRIDPISNASQFSDSTTPLGISATFTGTTRDLGTNAPYNVFVANAYADQSGTVKLEKSIDGSTWVRATADIAVTPTAPVELKMKVTTRYVRVVYVNGATGQGAFNLSSALLRTE